MTDALEDLLDVTLGERAVAMTVDGSVYPLEAVYGAAYVFIDRCWVFVDRAGPDRFAVRLTAKGDIDEAGLRALAGEFGNELLSCAWRADITRNNRAVIEAVTTQAFGGAIGPPSLDELAGFDFSDEAFEDPLGIAQSWEQKHGKKAPEGEG